MNIWRIYIVFRAARCIDSGKTNIILYYKTDVIREHVCVRACVRTCVCVCVIICWYWHRSTRKQQWVTGWLRAHRSADRQTCVCVCVVVCRIWIQNKRWNDCVCLCQCGRVLDKIWCSTRFEREWVRDRGEQLIWRRRNECMCELCNLWTTQKTLIRLRMQTDHSWTCHCDDIEKLFSKAN